jgi:hypothetical protein
MFSTAEIEIEGDAGALIKPNVSTSLEVPVDFQNTAMINTAKPLDTNALIKKEGSLSVSGSSNLGGSQVSQEPPKKRQKGGEFRTDVLKRAAALSNTRKDRHKTTVKRLVTEEERGLMFAKDKSIAFRQVNIENALELNELTRIVSRRNLNTKELTSELAPFYFLPKNPTKSMLQRVLSSRCAQVLEKPVLFGLPSKEIINEYASQFDMTVEELLNEISVGLCVGKENRGAKEDEDGSDISDGDYSLGISELSSEDVKGQEDELEEVAKVIASRGIQFYPFRFGLRFSYSQLAKLFFLSKGYRLPFGRTIPGLSWVYLLSLVLDGENVLNLRVSKDEHTFSLGGMNAVEQAQLSEARSADTLVELYRGFSKESDSGAIGIVTRVMRTLKRMSLASRKLSELNEMKVDMHGRALQAVNNAKRSAKIIKDIYPTAYEKYEDLVSMTLAAVQPNTDLHRFRKNAGKALKINLPEKTPLMSNILFPYTGTCLNFMRDIKAMYVQQLENPKHADEIKGKFIRHIHMNSNPETGYMAYLIGYISDRPNDKVLELWFGLEFKDVVNYLKVIDKMDPLNRLNKAHKVNTLGVGHLKISESGVVYQDIDGDDEEMALETFLGKRAPITSTLGYVGYGKGGQALSMSYNTSK